MTDREFCYWLQGLFEVADPKSLDERQTAMIRDHLKLVFTKVTPPIPSYAPNDLQKILREGGPFTPFGRAKCSDTPLPNAVAYC